MYLSWICEKGAPPKHIQYIHIPPKDSQGMDFPLEKSNKPSTRKQIPDGIIFPLKHQRNNYKVVPPK